MFVIRYIRSQMCLGLTKNALLHEHSSCASGHEGSIWFLIGLLHH